MSILWTDKYKPEKISDIAGQGKALKQIQEWFDSWKNGKALLLSGGPGTGKTLSIEVLSKESGWLLSRMNASDSRTSDDIRDVIGESSSIRPLFHKKKIILIDEVDGISSTERGATRTLIDIVRKSSFPVVFIANDPWIPKLRTLRNYCTHVKFGKVGTPSIEKFLREILEKESVEYEGLVLKNLARWSNGDIRSAIIDLQSVAEGESKIDEDSLLSLGFRERGTDMFSIMPAIFRSGKINAVKKMIWEADKDADTVFWWIENNIPIEFSKAYDIRRSYDILSKADIFRNYVSQKQNWRFKAYMVDMMSGVSVGRKEEPKHGWVRYEPPQKIIMMAARKKDRAEVKEIYEKIGNHTHLSNTMIRSSLLPYLKMILASERFAKDKNKKDDKEKPKVASLMAFSKKPDISQNFPADLKLSEEEIAILLG